MARGNTRALSESLGERNELREPGASPKALSAKTIESISKPLIDALVRQKPIIPSKSPGNPGDKDVLPMDAIFDEVEKSIPSGDYLEKEYSNRAKAAYVALAMDMLELNLLQAEKAGRVVAAREYGPKDEAEVAARMDKQIDTAKSSIKDNIEDLHKQTDGELDVKQIAQDLAYGITNAIRIAVDSDYQRPRYGGNFKNYSPTESRERKKQINDLYNHLNQ